MEFRTYNSLSLTTATMWKSRTHSSRTWKSIPLAQLAPFRLSEPLASPFFLRVLGLTCLTCSCKWDHAASLFLCLTYCTRHSVLKVPPRCHKRWDFLLLRLNRCSAINKIPLPSFRSGKTRPLFLCHGYSCNNNLCFRVHRPFHIKTLTLSRSGMWSEWDCWSSW